MPAISCVPDRALAHGTAGVGSGGSNTSSRTTLPSRLTSIVVGPRTTRGTSLVVPESSCQLAARTRPVLSVYMTSMACAPGLPCGVPAPLAQRRIRRARSRCLRIAERQPTAPLTLLAAAGDRELTRQEHRQLASALEQPAQKKTGLAEGDQTCPKSLGRPGENRPFGLAGGEPTRYGIHCIISGQYPRCLRFFRLFRIFCPAPRSVGAELGTNSRRDGRGTLKGRDIALQ